MSVKGLVIATSAKTGDRSLKQGDLLSAGDELTVGNESYVDLAYDKEWKNVTRLESNTNAKLISVAPGKLDLKDGTIFAKLNKLPRRSEFEVITPAAVATVRGTEYITKHVRGRTEVLNASASPIFVYGVKADGTKDKASEVVLERSKKTGIEKSGQPPTKPVVMTEEDEKAGDTLKQDMNKNIETAQNEGRESSLQSVEEIEAMIKKAEEEAQKNAVAPPNDSDLSRVTDNRRRAFGGQNVLAPPEPRMDEPQQQEPQKQEQNQLRI